VGRDISVFKACS